MKTFGGPVLFLDRSDINTDEIIPAKYLTEVEKDALKPHLLEDLHLEGFDPAGEKVQKARVIVTRENFGCGSSREHAPWALEVNDITVVLAQSFARIFRQNMYNGGMIAAELPANIIDELFIFGQDSEVTCDVDLDKRKLIFTAQNGSKKEIDVPLGEFDEALVRAGGWVEYADTHY